MKDSNLDDLIIDQSSTPNGGKNKNILTAVILLGIILLIAILLTKIMIDEPMDSPLADRNETKLANDDLLLDTNNSSEMVDLNESTTVSDSNISNVKQIVKEESEKMKESTSVENVAPVPAAVVAAKVAQEVEKKVEAVKAEVPKVEKKVEAVKAEVVKPVAKKEVPKVEKKVEAVKAEVVKPVAKKEVPKVEKKAEAVKAEVVKPVAKKEVPKVEKKVEATKEETSGKEYYIQAGAFGSSENVSKAEAAIKASGLTPKSQKREKGTKVMVGPFSSMEKAQAALGTVKSKVNKDAFIVKP